MIYEFRTGQPGADNQDYWELAAFQATLKGLWRLGDVQQGAAEVASPCAAPGPLIE